MGETALSRYKWTAWFLSYYCSLVPILVGNIFSHDYPSWYSPGGWAVWSLLLLVYFYKLYKKRPLQAGWMRFLLVISGLWTLVSFANAFTPYDDQKYLKRQYSEDELKGLKANYYAGCVSGVLAIMSMVVQWKMDRGGETWIQKG